MPCINLLMQMWFFLQYSFFTRKSSIIGNRSRQ